MTKKPVDYFLSPIENKIHYSVVRLALLSDLSTPEIAEEEGIGLRAVQTRIKIGAAHLGIGTGREGLKTAYIHFLEDWIETRGME